MLLKYNIFCVCVFLAQVLEANFEPKSWLEVLCSFAWLCVLSLPVGF